MWRPEKWKNPNEEYYHLITDLPMTVQDAEYEAYEAGADAMLKALKCNGKEAVSLKNGVATFGQPSIKIGDIDYPLKGTFVFIPDDTIEVILDGERE